jgi:hypothetical protein
MGSLPRDKAGVGSAVNDTTRQMGGAIGVALIGAVVSSIYASEVTSAARRFGVTGSDLAEAKSSLGGGLKVAASAADGFANAVKTAFVDGLSSGLRMASVFVVFAGVVVWRYLPARGDVADTLPAATPEDIGEFDDLRTLSGSLVAAE